LQELARPELVPQEPEWQVPEWQVPESRGQARRDRRQRVLAREPEQPELVPPGRAWQAREQMDRRRLELGPVPARGPVLELPGPERRDHPQPALALDAAWQVPARQVLEQVLLEQVLLVQVLLVQVLLEQVLLVQVWRGRGRKDPPQPAREPGQE
jgi:hypothetical protein